MPMTTSQRLRFTIDLAAPQLAALSHRFWSHPDFAGIYPTYLVSLYHSMRATVPLLETAAARADRLADRDPIASRLADYYRHHAREELHHDEWLLEDMALLGMDVEAVQATPAPPDIAELIGAQYYWLEFAHPVSVMGCFAVLEGAPPEAEVLDGIVERTGIPKAAMRTIYKHGVLDPHHRDDLDAMLDALPLTDAHRSLVSLSALQVVGRLCTVIGRLVGDPTPAGVAG